MAVATARLPSLFRSASSRPVCHRCWSLRFAVQPFRNASTEAPTSPLLAKVKGDLKAAMRAKDAARLTVIRGIISETNQLASGPNPIRTDMQLLALLKRRRSGSEDAAKEAQAANRHDLVEKQEKEIAILDEYVGEVKMMDVDEMRVIVRNKVEQLRLEGKTEVKSGLVMKELVKAGGDLDGKPIDKAVLKGIVEEESLSNPSKS